jgi:hypothetical protein
MILATNKGWNWTPAGEASFRYANNELMLAIPRSALPTSGGNPERFAFKWVDNVREDDLTAFTTDGDAAPNGRFNYLFTR